MAKSIRKRADLAVIAPEFNPSEAAHGEQLQGCCIIGLDTNDGPTHRYYDRRILQPVTEEQVCSMIASGGDIEPISIVKGPTPDVFIVRKGRRRVMAARAANERLIAQGLPPIRLRGVLHAGNDDRARIAIAQENMCKVDLTALDEAIYIRDIMAMGYDAGETARMLGKSLKWVESRLTIDEASEELKDAVRSGEIDTSAAVALASLPEEKQAEAVTSLVADAKAKGGKKVSTKAAREVAGRVGTHRPGLKDLKRWVGSDALPKPVKNFIHWYLTGEDVDNVPGLRALVEAGDKK